ncbi:MAG: hypothetical protein ACD_58C00316G0002 [uncultured bacterium]|nr:MAG: hypothetical protein ACD_58C00316G0002 [uncultured bacterium]
MDTNTTNTTSAISQKLIDVDILEALGLANLPEDQKMEMLASFADTVMQTVMIRVAVRLIGPDADEFDKIVDAKDEQKIGEFLQSKVPDIEQLVTNETLKLKQVLIERVKKVDEQLEQNTALAV